MTFEEILTQAIAMLQRLGRVSYRALKVQALLGDDPSLEALKPLLIARTAGNSFCLEESVRTLVETDVLVGERGAYRLAQALASQQVPATVQAVLTARIDRLPPEKKSLLQTAAVCTPRWGLVFWPSTRVTCAVRCPCSNGPSVSVRKRTSGSLPPGWLQP
jgi:predicted ATPase